MDECIFVHHVFVNGFSGRIALNMLCDYHSVVGIQQIFAIFSPLSFISESESLGDALATDKMKSVVTFAIRSSVDKVLAEVVPV